MLFYKVLVCGLGAIGLAQGQQGQAETKTAGEVLAATLADLQGSKEALATGHNWAAEWTDSHVTPFDFVGKTTTPPKTNAVELLVSVARLKHKVPKAAEQAIRHASRLVQKKNTTKAMEEYRRAIEIDPEFAEAHQDLGALYVRLKRYQEAQAEFRRTIELIPESSAAYSNLGWVLTTLGEFAQAEQSARRALQLSNRNAAAHLLLGWLLVAAPATRKEGVGHLEYAAQTMPAAVDALRQLAGVN